MHPYFDAISLLEIQTKIPLMGIQLLTAPYLSS